LWKTLRIWASKVAKGKVDLSSIILSLVTTACAPAGSAAALLRDGTARDEGKTLQILRRAGAASAAEVVKKGYAAFSALSAEVQASLVSRIRVLDASPDILMARAQLEFPLRYSTRAEFLSAFCDRLEGWWFRRAVAHIQKPETVPSISWREVQLKIEDLAEQFKRDNLPIDFPSELDMEETALPADERVFVEQLRLIALGSQRVKIAISDYWRAFQQRSRWVRENLRLDEALEQYEDRLIREWKEQFLMMQENMKEGADSAEEERSLFNRVVVTGNHIPIRPSFPNPFVMRGSFHILANSLKVGWHPAFQDRLAKAFERAIGSAK
jgi:C-terminal domain 7 of the ABC-three component (ABC-3C) systems